MEAERGDFQRVVVDDEIQGDAVEFFGEPVECEVFRPDAGMGKLRLVAGQQEWLLGSRRGRGFLGGRVAAIPAAAYPDLHVAAIEPVRLAAINDGTASKPGSAKMLPLAVGA